MSETLFYNSKNLVGIGAVGIGTTSPGSNLHVYTSSLPSIRIEAPTSSGQDPQYQLYASGSQVSKWAYSWNGVYTYFQNDSGQDFMRVYTGAGGNVVLQPVSGNVGIGTTNPGSNLHLYSTSGANLRIESNTAGDPTFSFYQDLVAKYNMGYSRAGGYTYFQNNTGQDFMEVYNGTGGNVVLQPASGKVGIGTQNPAVALDVYTGAMNAATITTSTDATFNLVNVGQGNASGGGNTAIGLNALVNNVVSGIGGQNNLAVGQDALKVNTGVGSGGYNNTAIGSGALSANTTGLRNTALGRTALATNTTHNNCTAVGQNALFSTDGNNNTALGQGAGNNITTGANNLCLGQNATASSATISNEVTIYNGTNQARFQGSATAWSFTSDGRDKTNVSNIPVGLDFINSLRPVSYQFDRRDWYEDKTPDGSKIDPKVSIGFIAQEVDEAIQKSGYADQINLVVKNDPENLMLSETNIIPILAKAIQELSARLQVAEQEIALLKTR